MPTATSRLLSTWPSAAVHRCGLPRCCSTGRPPCPPVGTNGGPPSSASEPTNWQHESAWAGGTAPSGPSSPSTHHRCPPDCPSARPRCCRCVAEGLSNRDIGLRLFISQNTVANHIRTILRKTGCANRTEATTYAHRTGVIARLGPTPLKVCPDSLADCRTLTSSQRPRFGVAAAVGRRRSLP